MDTLIATAVRFAFDKFLKKAQPLQPGSYHVDETLTIRVIGDVNKIADEEYTPTVSIPYKKAFEMFLARMGIQREAAMEALVQSMTDAVNGVCPADIGMDDYINVDDVEKIVQEGLAAMPKKTRTGKTFVECTAVVASTNPTVSVTVP